MTHRYSERCRSALDHRYTRDSFADRPDRHRLLLNRVFLSTVVGSDESLADLFEPTLALYGHSADAEALMSLVAITALSGEDAASLAQRALDTIDLAIDDADAPPHRAILTESAAAVALLAGDHQRSDAYRHRRLAMPLFKYMQASAIETLYLIGPSADDESLATLALSVARIGIYVTAGGTMETVAPLVTALAAHAVKAGTSSGALLRGAAQRLDAAAFKDDGSERFTFTVKELTILLPPPRIALQIAVDGEGTIVAGAHDIPELTWQLPETYPRARQRLAEAEIPPTEPLGVDGTLHLGSGVEADDGVATAIRGRTETVLEQIDLSSDLNVEFEPEIRILRAVAE